jgi:hypothetical protein
MVFEHRLFSDNALFIRLFSRAEVRENSLVDDFGNTI